MSLMNRRRVLIGWVKEKPVVPTKLTTGEYTRGNSSWIVDERGKVTITNWPSAAQNAFIISLDKAISIKQDDEIVFQLLRKSGSPGWHGTDVNLYRSESLNLLTIGSNLTWNWSNNTNSVSKTSNVSGDITHIYINNRGNVVAGSANYSFALKMTINGKVVLE